MKRSTLHKVCLVIMVLFFAGFHERSCAQVQDVPFSKDYFPKEQREQLQEAVRNIKEGDEFFEIGQRAAYLQALDYYLKANNFNPNNAELNYKIGKCYLFSMHKAKSIYFLEKANKMKPNVAPDLSLLLAQAFHFNLEIDKAEEYYKIFLGHFAPNDQGLEPKDIERKIRECETARWFIKHPERVFIDNLGDVVNTSFPEYAPVITADESKMLFTSCRDNTIGGGIDPIDLFYYEDIYISPHSPPDLWSAPIHPGKPLNTDFHDATVGLSPDGRRLLMYRGDNGGDLFESVLQGDEYGDPYRLPNEINTKYHECSASYSPDQNTLYFVSDKPGGQGGHDIWVAKRDKKGRWETAVNLGPTVNTTMDEAAVFMHPDGKTLYFSSEGHETMGGFDLFYSVFENGGWSEPKNLGYPINSTDDDLFLVLSADGRHGYYASYKPDGYGDKDIYRITFLGPEKPLIDDNEDNLLASIIEPFRQAVFAPTIEIPSSQLTLLKGIVVDAVSREPLGASIEITDNEKDEQVTITESNSKSGRFLVALPSGINYGIAVRKDGYLFYSENIDIPRAMGYSVVEKEIALEKIEVGKKIVLRNIFFDVDKFKLRPESKAELDRLLTLMNEMPKLRIEISGHTDNQGTEAHNQVLSQNRAKAVVIYLIEHGIEADRMVYQGYGYSQPVATNSTAEGRQLNRRTEFKIIAK